MIEHKTHTGEVITGERLKSAVDLVAHDWRNLAYAIRTENSYASHVTEQQKYQYMHRKIKQADELQDGGSYDFTFWQRINEKLTGECVAFLP